MEIMNLFFTPDEDLYDKRITDVFDDEVFSSNFWLYWRTMFAFENWHSALEMKLYIKRFIHHIGGLPDFKALRFTRYNQYESIILPMEKYLKDHGVQFHYSTKVTDVRFEIKGDRKQATSITVEHEGQQSVIDLTENDLLFITNGGCVEAHLRRSEHPRRLRHEPEARQRLGFVEEDCGAGSQLRSSGEVLRQPRREQLDERDHHHAGRQDPAVYSAHLQARPLHGGHTDHRRHCDREGFQLADVLGRCNRQQQFRDQPKNQLCVWVYGLFTDKPGNYVKKPMRECTGKEICMEWLYHMGVPESEIEELAEKHANSVPVMMPYIDAFFMPRRAGDRPRRCAQGCGELRLHWSVRRGAA